MTHIYTNKTLFCVRDKSSKTESTQKIELFNLILNNNTGLLLSQLVLFSFKVISSTKRHLIIIPTHIGDIKLILNWNIASIE